MGKHSATHIRRIPFGTLSITESAREHILHALDSRRLSCGALVAEFERQFADFIGAGEAVSVSTGTDADALALAVLYDFGANRGDEVIIPSLSFVATGNAVLQAGFTPVFVDIDRRTLTIDPSGIEQAITEKTRAIMPVHLMGKPADMDPILHLAQRYGLLVVEDAAEAHGATYKGKNVGTIGDLGAFSLYVAHIISTIEGGIVVTNRPEMADILRSLRSHGRACTCSPCQLNTESGYCPKRFQSDGGMDIRFVFDRIGFSSKMNELEAAVGLGTLGIVDRVIEKRRANLLALTEGIRQFDQFYTIHAAPHEEIGPHAFPVILTEDCPFTREDFARFLEEKGIETRTLFASMPTQCSGFAYLGHRYGEFPNAEYVGKNGIHIGVHQDLDRDDCDYVIDTVGLFLATYNR